MAGMMGLWQIPAKQVLLTPTIAFSLGQWRGTEEGDLSALILSSACSSKTFHMALGFLMQL